VSYWGLPRSSNANHTSTLAKKSKSYMYLTIVEIIRVLKMELKLPPKVTDRAFTRILEISESKCLRIAVEGGGCSGFQYDIRLEQKESVEDIVFNKNGAKVVIDPISLEFLAGATIDFSEELIGAKFTIENPNATSSCGCGTSFSV
jgi:iron-sulfur cluster assembly accessory protein